MKETLSVEKYLNTIYDECDNTIVKNKNKINNKKKKEKVDDECVTIPGTGDYERLLTTNYNQNQLKNFAKFYKLKVSGNKQQLIDRLFSFYY
jgi:hypothetical protein